MVIFIGALVQRRDGDTSVLMIVDIDFCNRNNKKQQEQLIKRSTNNIAMLKNEA